MSAQETEVLRAEVELLRQQTARLQQSLVEAQRFATVGQLSCQMAHEFNNVLMMISGHAGHALQYDDPELRQKALQKAVECSQRGADIVAGLLRYANGRQMQSRPVAAGKLMTSAVALIAWNLPKNGIQLVPRYETDCQVRVVPGRIEQVLVNLILNACNAMKGRGGRLTVIVQEADTPGYVALRVQDTGCGIPAEHFERIFDPFFTTHPRPEEGRGSEGGTGLGLLVARDLVRQAGGEIHVESTLNEGSTFTVLLPIIEDTE